MSRRSAEKDRKSSCVFADRIAEASIAAYRRFDAPDYDQTCLAAFGFHYHDATGAQRLEIVSWGTGTKV